MTPVLAECHGDIPHNGAVRTNDASFVSVATAVNDAADGVPYARVPVLIGALPKFEDGLPTIAFLYLEVNALVDVRFVTCVHAH